MCDVESAPDRGEPAPFVLVVLVVERPTIGHIHGPDAQARTGRAQCPRFRVGKPGLVSESTVDVREADLREDGDAIPSAVTVEGELVAEGLDLRARKGSVGDLRFLQAEYVRLRRLEPAYETREPCDDGVDVPGGQAHGCKDSR